MLVRRLVCVLFWRWYQLVIESRGDFGGKVGSDEPETEDAGFEEAVSCFGINVGLSS